MISSWSINDFSGPSRIACVYIYVALMITSTKCFMLTQITAYFIVLTPHVAIIDTTVPKYSCSNLECSNYNKHALMRLKSWDSDFYLGTGIDSGLIEASWPWERVPTLRVLEARTPASSGASGALGNRPWRRVNHQRKWEKCGAAPRTGHFYFPVWVWRNRQRRPSERHSPGPRPAVPSRRHPRTRARAYPDYSALVPPCATPGLFWIQWQRSGNNVVQPDLALSRRKRVASGKWRKRGNAAPAHPPRPAGSDPFQPISPLVSANYTFTGTFTQLSRYHFRFILFLLKGRKTFHCVI